MKSCRVFFRHLQTGGESCDPIRARCPPPLITQKHRQTCDVKPAGASPPAARTQGSCAVKIEATRGRSGRSMAKARASGDREHAARDGATLSVCLSVTIDHPGLPRLRVPWRRTTRHQMCCVAWARMVPPRAMLEAASVSVVVILFEAIFLKPCRKGARNGRRPLRRRNLFLKDFSLECDLRPRLTVCVPK